MSSKKKNKNNSGDNNSQATQSSSNKQSQQHAPRKQYSAPPAKASVKHAREQWTITARRLMKSRHFPVAVVVVLAILPSIYFYHQSKQAEQKVNDSTSTHLQTTAEVVKRVSRHILLPSGEQPTVATVSDASKVRSQAFFTNAASGDKVLIYAQAKKAYLYRPSIDRIIEVAPLAPNTPSTTP